MVEWFKRNQRCKFSSLCPLRAKINVCHSQSTQHTNHGVYSIPRSEKNPCLLNSPLPGPCLLNSPKHDSRPPKKVTIMASCGHHVVFDLETTGLDPQADNVVAIGAVNINTGDTFKRFVKLASYDHMHPKALAKHGLGGKFLDAHGVPFGRAVREFRRFVGDGTLIAHGSLNFGDESFDKAFLDADCEKHDLPPMKNNVIDTMFFVRNVFKFSRCSIDDLCARFNIDAGDRSKHDALEDALLLMHILRELCELAPDYAAVELEEIDVSALSRLCEEEWECCLSCGDAKTTASEGTGECYLCRRDEEGGWCSHCGGEETAIGDLCKPCHIDLADCGCANCGKEVAEFADLCKTCHIDLADCGCANCGKEVAGFGGLCKSCHHEIYGEHESGDESNEECGTHSDGSPMIKRRRICC